MRYGETSYDKEKEFEDEEDYTEELVEESPRRKGSLLPGIKFNVSIPNSMSKIHGMNNIDIGYNPSKIHNSTPQRSIFPKAAGGITMGHNSMRVLDTGGLPKIGGFKKRK